jgi:RHS repeat-associated protein
LENRLSSVTLPGTGGTVNFTYDPFGRRIEKVAPTSGAAIYAYDGDNVTEEFGAAGNVLAQYTQDAGIDEPLAVAESGGTYYYHADGLGSILSLTNGSGQLANSYVYDSFGNLTASTGTFPNPFQYTGRGFDSETGLFDYRARYYDPSTGRFTSQDPAGFNGGYNFYVYVSNDPIDYSDPLGLKKCQTYTMLVTSYCSKGPGADWPYYKPTKKGGKPRSVGPGTIAVAPTTYLFGCSVKVHDGSPTGPVQYTGTIHDTGAGWDANHHNVPPGLWIDIWKPCKAAKLWGTRVESVEVCCDCQ